MKCHKCNRELRQVSAFWTPKTQHYSYRKYICYHCGIVFTEVVELGSHNVIRVDESDPCVKRERQSTLYEF